MLSLICVCVRKSRGITYNTTTIYMVELRYSIYILYSVYEYYIAYNNIYIYIYNILYNMLYLNNLGSILLI